MRQLTLVLSDLYLPEESARAALPTAIPLPSLDELLRFSNLSWRVKDWRHWLAHDVGLRGLSELPVAEACARNVLPSSDAAAVWLATPVHLEARLDHVRLADRGLLELDEQERQVLCSEFEAAFAPQYRLHDTGERGFLLSGLAPASVATVDPARLLDADIAPALARGPAAGELRRLGAEIEMWLHGSPLNAARDRNRLRRISALWLWGGGSPGDRRGSDAPARTRTANVFRFLGADPFLPALRRAVEESGKAAASSGNVPATFSELADDDADVVAELAPLSGATRDALHSLEANWFAPIRAALAAHTLAEFVFVANDRCFLTTPGKTWKFWRSRMSWLARLAASP